MHVAVWSGRKTWADGVSALVDAEPRAVRVRDGDDGVDGTAAAGLLPFQMAAARYSFALTDDERVRLARRAQNGHLGADWRSMNLRRRAEEVMKVREERDVDELGTVWELLRAAPDLVGERLPVRSAATKERLKGPRLGNARAASASGGEAWRRRRRCQMGMVPT